MWATRTISDLFRPRLIVGALPVTLLNGTTADATQVMADLNWIVNQVNANAAPLATTALTNANNNFTAVQSGLAASAAANFPIASQVQNFSFNTLSSTLGTNTISSRVSALPLTAYAQNQIFTFIPAQTNTGPATMAIDTAGTRPISKYGLGSLVASDLVGGRMALIVANSTTLELLNPQTGAVPSLPASTLVGNPTGSTAGATAVTLGSALAFSGQSLIIGGLPASTLIGNPTAAAGATNAAIPLGSGLVFSGTQLVVNNVPIVSSGLLGSPIAANTVYSFAHGLGARPSNAWAVIRANTNDVGFTSGMEVGNPSTGNGAGANCNACYWDATNVYYAVDEAIVVQRPDTNVQAAITLSAWNLILRAQR